MRYVEPILVRHNGQEYSGLPLDFEGEETVFTVLRHSSRRVHRSGCAAGSNCRSSSSHKDMLGGTADYDIVKRRTSGEKASVISYCEKCIREKPHLEAFRSHLEAADRWARRRHKSRWSTTL